MSRLAEPAQRCDNRAVTVDERNDLWETPTVAKRRSSRTAPSRAAVLISGIALTGLCVSLFLTVAKFRSAYHCDFSLLSACKVGPFLSCDRVLSSPWSEIAGYPITIAATAFYIVVLRLALGLPFASTDSAVDRALLHYFGLLGVIASIPLAAYAFFAIGGGCSYCASLYALNIALLLSTAMLGPRGSRKLLGHLWSKKLKGRGIRIRQTALLFFAALLVQMVIHDQRLRDVETEPRCITDVRGLPSSRLSYLPNSTKLSHPVAEVTLAVDLVCESCRVAFNYWYEVAREKKGALRLNILHLPMAGEPCLITDASTQSVTGVRPESRFHHSCQAARAIECTEDLAPGSGMQMVKELFDRQRYPLDQKVVAGGEKGAFTVKNLLVASAAASGFGHSGEEMKKIESCIRDETPGNPALQVVNAHTTFVYNEKGARGTPAIFLTFLNSEHDRLPLGLQLDGNKKYRDFDRFLNHTRNQVTKLMNELSKASE